MTNTLVGFYKRLVNNLTFINTTLVFQYRFMSNYRYIKTLDV